MDDKERAERRMDYLWAAVAADAYLTEFRAGTPLNVAAVAAVKIADLAEKGCSAQASIRGARREKRPARAKKRRK